MDKHFVSDELFGELRMLPNGVLLAAAYNCRETWFADPDDGDALMSFLIMSEAVAERGLQLPEPVDEAVAARAFERFCEIMSASGF